jgi:hypothetical protein
LYPWQRSNRRRTRFIIALGLGLGIARPAIVLITDTILADARWRFQTLDGAVSLGRMLNIVLLNFLFFLLPAISR